MHHVPSGHTWLVATTLDGAEFRRGTQLHTVMVPMSPCSVPSTVPCSEPCPVNTCGMCKCLDVACTVEHLWDAEE